MKYKAFVESISSVVPKERIYTDALRTLAWGTDAGFYRLLPKVIVRAQNDEQIAAILRTASQLEIPVTFRAAGTSLSGQAISDSVLVVAGKSWERYRILDDKATTVALQPGIVGQRVNDILKPYGRCFSPDPASSKSAMVGGIVANNASGMKCGTHANSDRILRSIKITLADGSTLDTADEESCRAFAQLHPDLLSEIRAIRDHIQGNKELADLLRHKYAIKNVTGLNMRPFLEYDNPFDIIAHCMVGSEGTLAFINEVTVATEAIKPFSASAMVYFSDMKEACRCVVALKKAGTVQACEMLDKKSLACVGDTSGEGLTALLIMTEAASKEELDTLIEKSLEIISAYDTFTPAQFSSDPVTVGKWWQIRSGVFPEVGGSRPAGTTALIEDVAFHIEDLPEATIELAELLEDCGYEDACIYGHALEGNYHFIIAQAFDTLEEVKKYRGLMTRIEDLVVNRYKGSLKAEHGTGRNMAPFVEAEWGAEIWKLMKRLKKAFDPKNILNPGVIFNDDPLCYISGMKPLPMTNHHVDPCIECGFCEVNCASCGLTLSARQRTVVRREISRLENLGLEPERLAELKREFKYLGNATCAGDGLCSTSCPMHLNTGEMIHDIRAEALTPLQRRLGRWTAKHLSEISSGLRLALDAASLAKDVIGDKGVDALGRAMHKAGIPLWTSTLPGASHKLDKDSFHSPRKVVYFSSCINRSMGASKEGGHTPRSLSEVFISLCKKAGVEVIIPQNVSGLCCGMIWESKGMPDIADAKTAELEAALLQASDNGRIPVVCDQSPCLHRMKEHIKSLRLYELCEYVHDELADHLDFLRVDRNIALHLTCSSRRMGIASKITDLASMCSSSVFIPAEIGCCGFAGDKGFTHPELNTWALRKLRPQIEANGIKEGYSNSRTCEIGLSTNSGIPYKSLIYLVDECTTPKK